MGGPAFLAVYWSVSVRFKRPFTFGSTIAANGCMNWLLMELLENMVVLEARPPRLGVTKHLRVIF